MSQLTAPRPDSGPADAALPRSTRVLSDERKREILGQLLFEDERRGPYLRNFFTLLILSVIIASAGLLSDSTAVVIAAMLVAPLMTPILATAAAMVNLWARRFLEQFLLVALGTVLAIALAAGLAFVFGLPPGWSLPDEILARTRPGAPDLLVALAAGFAGAYVLARREALSAVAGVAIAVALVPPLSTCGVLLYLGQFDLALRAFVLYATNYSAIVFTACAVFIVQGLTPDFSRRFQRLQLGVAVVGAGVLVLIIAVPLIAETYRDVLAARGRVLDHFAVRWTHLTVRKMIQLIELEQIHPIEPDRDLL